MERKPTSFMVMGLVISLILIVISLVQYFAGLYTQSWSKYIGLLVFAAGIIFAIANYAKEKEYYVTFGNLFGYGFAVTAFITVLVTLYTMLSFSIFPDMKDRIMEVATQEALANPKANEEQVRQGMAMFERNFSLFMVISSVVGCLLTGVVAALIGAAVVKKRGAQTPFENV